jgi:hypothetical protein
MAGDNLYYRTNGQRECKQCRRDRARNKARENGIPARRVLYCDVESSPPSEGYHVSQAVHNQRER